MIVMCPTIIYQRNPNCPFEDTRTLPISDAIMINMTEARISTNHSKLVNENEHPLFHTNSRLEVALFASILTFIR